jgi:hemin uptake protein HemP
VTKVPPHLSSTPRRPRLESEIRLAEACAHRVRSLDLLGEDEELLIDHNGEYYLLSCLPGGRLVLRDWDGRARRLSRHSSRIR